MIRSKAKKGLLKVRNRKTFESLNFLAFRIFFKNFLRHPEVTDERTNVKVGAGNGMARSTDPLKLALIFLRHVGLPFFSNSFILDLGCGDGIVLKLLERLGYRKIVGVESDRHLCFLAKQNSKKSKIIEGNFLHRRIIAEVAALKPRIIYLFNPAPPHEVLFFLESLINETELVLILRNPEAFQDICSSTKIQVLSIHSYDNYKILKIQRARKNLN